MSPGFINKGLLMRECKKNIHIYNFINYNDWLTSESSDLWPDRSVNTSIYSTLYNMVH